MDWLILFIAVFALFNVAEFVRDFIKEKSRQRHIERIIENLPESDRATFARQYLEAPQQNRRENTDFA